MLLLDFITFAFICIHYLCWPKVTLKKKESKRFRVLLVTFDVSPVLMISVCASAKATVPSTAIISAVQFTFSLAMSQCTGTATVGLGWLSLTAWYWHVLNFLDRLFLWKYHPYNRKIPPYHCARPLFIQGHGSGNLSTLVCVKREKCRGLFILWCVVCVEMIPILK